MYKYDYKQVFAQKNGRLVTLKMTVLTMMLVMIRAMLAVVLTSATIDWLVMCKMHLSIMVRIIVIRVVRV